jgi:very-short-patch-repair endonuclease
LWRILSSYRPRFTRQHVVGSYIVDLACGSAKLAVELDGSQHLERASYDQARTEFLEQLGWRVIRVWNSEVADNPDGVAEAILQAVEERLQSHPRPLPVPREGRNSRRGIRD